MIHRFLIYDKKFNCRLDRRYPLKQFNSFNRDFLNFDNETKVPNLVLEQPNNETVCNSSDDNWDTLIINSGSEDEEDYDSKNINCELERLNIKSEIIEHSQQLILGMTHSLKSMFLKLSPNTTTAAATAINSSDDNNSLAEGYSFSLKTSKYRLFYFESFTGWKLVMVTDCNQTSQGSSNNAHNSVTISGLGLITPDTSLKIFYTNILLKYLVTYPLGTILKTCQNSKVENDFLHRPGFLSKMDEFIQNVDSIF